MRTIMTFMLASLLTLSAACGSPVERAPVPEKNEAPIRSLAILPAVLQLELPGQKTDIRQLRKGEKVLDELYSDYFQGVDAVTILSEERKEALSSELTGSRLERARRIGKKLGSDGVLVTRVVRFHERMGTPYAVNSPASVAFRFKLVRVDNGNVACVGQFDETQQPLTENILAFRQAARRGFKWITARELAREGLWQQLDECGPLRLLRPPRR